LKLEIYMKTKEEKFKIKQEEEMRKEEEQRLLVEELTIESSITKVVGWGEKRKRRKDHVAKGN